MSMITITPIVVPPWTPALQPRAVTEPSWPNTKRSREDDDGRLCDAKRPCICPTLADTLAFLTTDAWPTELGRPSTPCSSTDTDSHSETSLETNGEHLVDSIPDGALDGSSLSIGQADVSFEEGYRFESEDDLLAWVCSLPDIDDELSEGDPSPSTSDIPTSPCPSPPPIFAVEDDRLSTEPSDEQLLHYIPPPIACERITRGPSRRTLDTEDLRKNVVNNLRWQRLYPSEKHALPPIYERDLPPCQRLGTPPRNIDDRSKLEPPASVYKYTLDSDNATALAALSGETRPDEDANGYSYSASELFGPDADMVRVARCAPVRPRALRDFCELTTAEHAICRKEDDAADPSTPRVKMRTDTCAVELWKASVNEVVEQVRMRKAEEERARLEAELRAFFEDAVDDDDDMEAVEIADLQSEADVSFDAEDNGTWGESSSEEDGEDVFDYDQWVADCLRL